MITLDRFIGYLAPHICLACGAEGHVLCQRCTEVAEEPLPPRCAGCHKLSDGWKTCASCRHWLHADKIIVAARYEGLFESLIHQYKFAMQRQAVVPIVQLMTESARGFVSADKEPVLCPIPTAPARIRERGFDHLALLAKEFARQTGMQRRSLLHRHSNVRQVGSTRTQRIRQMKHEFQVIEPERVRGRTILLLDDVMTTGATLAAASRALKQAGAKSVVALVFAQKT